MKTIAIIPARGGSVRIPRKNIRLFHGKPIIAYSIEAAKRSNIFDEIYVNTDDDEVAEVAAKHSICIWKRPYDDGTKGTHEVAADQLRKMGSAIWYGDLCCVIYPTAPMISAKVLVDAYEYFNHSPWISFIVPCAEWLKDPGQFYFGKVNAFIDNHPLIRFTTVLHKIDPATAIDINTEDDWLKAEQMYSNLHGLA